MGLGSMITEEALKATAQEAEMKERLKLRSPEQKKVIRYFYHSPGGCLGRGGLKDEEYESMVMAKATSMDFKQRALSKLGIEEEQVTEVAPIHFQGYVLEKDSRVRRGKKDRIWRTPSYQITWIFCSASQVYAYQYTFSMWDDKKKETTEEYFYKDIVNFSTKSSTSEEIDVLKEHCNNTITWTRVTVDTDQFAITVPSDSFLCAMEQNDSTEKAITGLKNKLREKKV